MAINVLRFKRATIVGQAALGVLLRRCDKQSFKWTGIRYVIFPGNVGTNETLYEVAKGWRSWAKVRVKFKTKI